MDSVTKNYVIGIDVGGTNTDGVLLEMPNKRVVSEIKTSTTKDIQSGVFNAMKGVLDR
jgi:N-methylhydantoinase A/oxoprolinase/acetone carboxylase beta subunit